MTTRTDAALADFLATIADALDAQADFEAVLSERTTARTKALREATEKATRLHVVEAPKAKAKSAA